MTAVAHPLLPTTAPKPDGSEHGVSIPFPSTIPDGLARIFHVLADGTGLQVQLKWCPDREMQRAATWTVSLERNSSQGTQ